jgi:hypothetical protein
MALTFHESCPYGITLKYWVVEKAEFNYRTNRTKVDLAGFESQAKYNQGHWPMVTKSFELVGVDLTREQMETQIEDRLGTGHG